MGQSRQGWTIPMFFWWILGVLTGCGSDEVPRLPELEVRDSAGIEIIQNGPRGDIDIVGWQIVEDPVLQIGSLEGDPAYLFEWIGDAMRLSDGRIVLTDRRSMNIRVFGQDGEHKGSFGRSGPGPKEFGGPPFLAFREPDTLVVWDGGHFRLSHYDLTGALLSQRSFSSTVVGFSITRGVHAWQVSAEGSVLWAGRAASRGGTTGIDENYRSIALIDGPTENTQDFGVFPQGQGLMLDIGIGFGNWFAPSVRGSLGPRPFRVAISSPKKREIRFFDSSGELRRILRATIPRVPVNAEVRAQRREYLVDWALQFRLPAGRGEWVDDQFPVPDSLPAIASIQWDRSDNLWVGRRVPDPNGTEVFDVFDIDARWINTIRIPRELGNILEIGEDYVLTSWRDDLGVPYLRMYRLLKPER